MKSPFEDEKVYNPGKFCENPECANYVRDDDKLCEDCRKRADAEAEVDKFYEEK